MKELQIFQNENFGEVRTITINEEIWFVGKDIANALGYVDTKDAIKKHVDTEDKQIIQRGQFTTLEIPNRGMTIINESGLYSLVLSSKLSTAKLFKRWITSEVLPTLRKTGTYTVHKIPFKEQVECIGIIADMLRVNDASKVLMLNKLYESNSLPTEFLPQYVNNGNRTLKSATELLKVFNLGMNAKNFNVLLRRNGFLEERTRLSTKGDEKKFNALTEEGLKYGENLINPFNQKEVQPMYYADTFQDLFKQVV